MSWGTVDAVFGMGIGIVDEWCDIGGGGGGGALEELLDGYLTDISETGYEGL
jgi:hypothetical protein